MQKLNNAMFDERNQFIAGKSSYITLDILMGCSLLVFVAFYSLGMSEYGNIIIAYILIGSILRIGVSIYLRHKL